MDIHSCIDLHTAKMVHEDDSESEIILNAIKNLPPRSIPVKYSRHDQKSSMQWFAHMQEGT